jgi:zeaxanthin glucosyltransferase
LTHFGVICPPISSHLRGIAAVSQELQQQGHEVTFLNIADIEAKIRAEGLGFEVIGQADQPPGSLGAYLNEMGQLSGFSAIRFGIQTMVNETRMLCRDAPVAIKRLGIEALLVDQGEPAGGAIAEVLGLPFITLDCGIAANQEPTIPPLDTPWQYHDTWWGIARNQIWYNLQEWVLSPVMKVVTAYRAEFSLPPYPRFDASFSTLAQISQQTAEFDFPRRQLPPWFHYIGMFSNTPPAPVSFPCEKLDGRPLIYASLGTLQNLKREIFYQIASACADLDAQLVLSLGGGSRVEDYPDLAGQPLMVNYAPQMALLDRAQMAITHGGLNSTLEALIRGVPLVALPIATDQPGVGARLAYSGAGEVVAISGLNATKLRTAVQRVLTGASYRHHAQRLQTSLQQAGGAKRAAEIIQQAVSTGQAVLRPNFK